MMNVNFRVYFDGYETPTKDFEIDEKEVAGMDEYEKEDYIRNQIYRYVCEQLEITEVEIEE